MCQQFPRRGTGRPRSVSYNEALKLFKAVGDHLGRSQRAESHRRCAQFRDEREPPTVSTTKLWKLSSPVGSYLGEANVLHRMAFV